MVRFTEAQAVAAAAIHQLINTWATSLDRRNGTDVASLVTGDCRYVVRGAPREGRDAVSQFYRERLAELEQTPAGPPTQRHVISNLVIDHTAEDQASVDFLLTYYLSPKKPPIMDLQGPTAIADCQMVCRREADGHWRIASFDSVQTFVRGPA